MLPRHAPRPRPERQPNRELAPARDRPRQEKVRHVRAGDDQHERGDQHQPERQIAPLSRRDRSLPARGMTSERPAWDRARRPRRAAALPPPGSAAIESSAPGARRATKRAESVHRRQSLSALSNPRGPAMDEGSHTSTPSASMPVKPFSVTPTISSRTPFTQQRLADRVSRAGKARLPHRVTDHGDRVRTRRPRRRPRRTDGRAPGGSPARAGNHARRHSRGPAPRRRRDQDRRAPDSRYAANAGKRRPTVAHRDVVDPQARPAIWRLHRARVAFDVEPSQRSWVRHRGRRTQEQAIDDAEDRRRAADAERERRDRRRGEGRPLAQHAKGKAHVLPHALDDRFPADVPHPIFHRLDAADLDACGANGRVAAHARWTLSVRRRVSRYSRSSSSRSCSTRFFWNRARNPPMTRLKMAITTLPVRP